MSVVRAMRSLRRSMMASRRCLSAASSSPVAAPGPRGGRGGAAALRGEGHAGLQALPVRRQLFPRCGAGLDEQGGGDIRELGGVVTAQIHGVYSAELVLVENGRVAADAVDAEALGEFVPGEDLLGRGGAGPGPGGAGGGGGAPG